MKSKLTSQIAFGKTAENLTLEFGPGRLKYTVEIPAGTEVANHGTPEKAHWLVNDFAMIADKNSILMHDAVHHGIPVPADKVVDVRQAK
ncbi:hypothetical protein AB2D15_31270 [Pseudomonas aeruginosa]